MSEERIVAVPTTAAEEASVAVCGEIACVQERLEALYAALGACKSPAELADMRPQLEAEAASLRRTAANLKAAQGRAGGMADEITARMEDMHKQLHRRWWRLNPPANGMIDLREENSFARGLNGYKLALVDIKGI